MKNRPARFLALGDSYTIGEAVATDVRWPAILVQRLRKAGIAVRDAILVAQTGWSTEELAAAMDKKDFNPPYDLVSLLIGVNDQYRDYDPEEYRDDFEALLKRAIALAGDRPEHVMVISLPDWGVTPFARKDERSRETISRQIDTYNRINKAIAEEYGVAYVNITDISRLVDEHIALVANDGLHPSGRQYRRWVERIFPVARDILSAFQR